MHPATPPAHDPAGRRPHELLTTVLTVVGTLALIVTLVAGWAEQTLFNSSEFAKRAVIVLDSSTVRHALAEDITDEIIAKGKPSLGSFRSELVGIVEDVMTTDGFREIFEGAIRQAHHVVFSRDSAAGLLELGETLKLVSDNAAARHESIASQLPSAGGSLLIDVTPIVHHIKPWRYPNDNRSVDVIALLVTLGSFGGVIALTRRRSAFELVGLGITAAGVAVVTIAEAVPVVAVSVLHDPVQAGAINAAIRSFVGDLLTLGLWTIPFGVLVIAAVHATERTTRTPLRDRIARARVRAGNLTGGPQLGLGAALVLLGALVVLLRDRILPLAVLVGGIAVIYSGTVLVIRAVLGPNVDEPVSSRSTNRRQLVLAVGGAAAFGFLILGLLVSVGASRSEARRAGELRCNGSAALCDRRLDQVVFAGSHNSMSAESDPSWLYAENLHGIPAQLQYGIRALLVKSHYGIATGITVAGAPLVVTDRTREIHADEDAEVNELGPDAVASVQAIDKEAGTVVGRPELYLCHGYCELGATKFSTTLDSIHQFMDSNPSDVIIMIIGDFVTPADTANAFKSAGLINRVWTYDRSKPPPTLREMIEAKRTLVVFSEHAGGTPSWYNPAYSDKGAFRDTPFTFAKPSEFSCAANRGTSSAPLFQINHWITNKTPPSPVQARSVNSYQSLMSIVNECRRERGSIPTVLGVNFYDQGDLLKVVHDLNNR